MSHCPLHGLDLFPSDGRVFVGIFPWLSTLCQPTNTDRRRLKETVNLPGESYGYASCDSKLVPHQESLAAG